MAYYCLHKLHLLPSQFIALPENERAFIAAAVELRAKAEKEAAERNGGRAAAGR